MKNTLRRTKPLLLGRFEITLRDQTVSYIIKRSSRARLVWLRISSSEGLTITVPRHYEISELPQYLLSKSRWILHHLKQVQTELPLLYSNITTDQPAVCYQGNPLQSCGEDQNKTYSLPDGSTLDYADTLDWLKRQAQKIISAEVQLFSKIIGVRFARISIRDQKTRWGSCSQIGNLNFNWRLIMAPEPILEYVIIHELCHLKRMSHGKAFWKVVTKYCPDCKEKRRWLTRHSRELHQFHSNSA
jgi:predicted metal-dependent hydrolase